MKKRQNAPVEMGLPRDLVEPRDGDDRAPRPVLGDEVGRAAGGRDDDDGRGEALGRCLDRGDGHGVGRVDRRHGLARQVGEQLVLPDRGLGLLADVGHGAHALQRVLALRGLA